MLVCKSKKQFRQFMLGQQAVTYGGVGSNAPQQTSYLVRDAPLHLFNYLNLAVIDQSRFCPDPSEVVISLPFLSSLPSLSPQNYENMFYSYDFHTGPKATKRFEPRFTSGAGVNPTTKQEEHWLGMSLCSMYDGEGMKTHGRPHLNLVIGRCLLFNNVVYIVIEIGRCTHAVQFALGVFTLHIGIHMVMCV